MNKRWSFLAALISWWGFNVAEYITLNKDSKLLQGNSKTDNIKAMRKEASRLASLANKRVARLERNELKDSPAYKQYIESGGKFGVKGKDYNQVQQELSRLRRFIDSQTSTVKGTIDNLKAMAANTGIQYKNLKDLKTKSAKFFELAGKVEQYLRSVDDMASAVGYQKIWEAINEYTDKARIDLGDSERDIDSMIQDVTTAIKEYETPDTINEINENFFYRLTD